MARRNLTKILFLTSALVSTTAYAEGTAPLVGADSATADSGVADIVVTAQRRSESMQKVPIAISAISAAAIAKAGIQNTSDLPTVTPGLQMTTARTTIIPYLRGVGTQNSGAGEEASIATYIDGVYVSALSSATLAFNNVARVEVLKGPQGTLFGRNATGGLINIITKDPSHTPSLTATAGYGNYDTWTGTVYGTAGLTEKIAADLAGYVSHQGNGFGHNNSGIAGLDGTDVNRSKEWAVRSKILFEATDDLKFTLAGDYDHRNSDLGISRQIIFGTVATCRGQLCNVPAVRALITPPGGQPILTIPYEAGALGRTFKGSVYDTASGETPFTNFHSYGGSLKAEYGVGDATLTSTSAYRAVLNDQNYDQDGGPLALADTRIRETTKTFQQELLLVGKVGRLDYTAGLFYFHAKAGVAPLQVKSIAGAASNFARTDMITTNSYAGFAQGTYAVTDTTNVTAGLRYTMDRKSITGTDIAVAGSTLPAGQVLVPQTTQSAKFNKLTYRFAVDQKLGENVLAYASYSRGFKSGVFNSTAFTDPAARPETLDAMEVGFKSDLLDRALRVNFSAFHYKYKDIQLLIVPGPGITRIINAASATIRGADLEIVAAPPVPVGRLQFTANMSYLHGRYGEFVNMPVLVPKINLTTGLPTGGATQLAVTTTGQTMVRTPPVTISLGADYSFPVADGDLDLSVNYYFNSGFYWDPDNRIKQKSYDLVNGQISYTLPGGKYSVAVYGRNLTNRFYYNQVSLSAGLGDQFTAGNPRTYGITLGVKLGQ